MRTLILSDLHLASRSSRAKAHLSALERLCREYDRVILNGDTLDRYECAGACKENDRFAVQVPHLFSSRSGPPEILCGNHDPGLSERNWVYLEASQTLVFHGDCIQDWTHPSRRQDRLLAAYLASGWEKIGGRPPQFLNLIDRYRNLQREYLIANPNFYESRSKLFYLLRAFVPPQRPFEILSYWKRAPKMVAQLALTFDRPVQTVIVGHSHRGGEFRQENVRVLNTGSFMPLSQPLAVVADGPHVSIRPLGTLLGARTSSIVASQRLT